jgi:cadmium resistance protein CadD (predicted permease)
MRSVLALILLATFAYVATMIDNLFAFAAQLTLTPRERFSAVTMAQSVGVVALVGLAAVVGASLREIPIRLVGVMALAPWAFAWHHWRRRGDESPSIRRGTTTTFLITLGLGGDNLAVWIPLLRASGTIHEMVVCLVFVLCQGLFVVLAWTLATHPRVVAWGQRGGRYFIPWLYVVLGVVILIECHVL